MKQVEFDFVWTFFMLYSNSRIFSVYMYYSHTRVNMLAKHYECLKIAMNPPKSCDLKVNNVLGRPKPLPTNISRIIRTLHQQYQWLTNLRKSMANYRLHNIR